MIRRTRCTGVLLPIVPQYNNSIIIIIIIENNIYTADYYIAAIIFDPF